MIFNPVQPVNNPVDWSQLYADPSQMNSIRLLAKGGDSYPVDPNMMLGSNGISPTENARLQTQLMIARMQQQAQQGKGGGGGGSGGVAGADGGLPSNQQQALIDQQHQQALDQDVQQKNLAYIQQQNQQNDAIALQTGGIKGYAMSIMGRDPKGALALLNAGMDLTTKAATAAKDNATSGKTQQEMMQQVIANHANFYNQVAKQAQQLGVPEAQVYAMLAPQANRLDPSLKLGPTYDPNEAHASMAIGTDVLQKQAQTQSETNKNNMEATKAGNDPKLIAQQGAQRQMIASGQAVTSLLFNKDGSLNQDTMLNLEKLKNGNVLPQDLVKYVSPSSANSGILDSQQQVSQEARQVRQHIENIAAAYITVNDEKDRGDPKAISELADSMMPKYNDSSQTALGRITPKIQAILTPDQYNSTTLPAMEKAAADRNSHPALDDNGQPMINPATGETVTNGNIQDSAEFHKIGLPEAYQQTKSLLNSVGAQIQNGAQSIGNFGGALITGATPPVQAGDPSLNQPPPQQDPNNMQQQPVQQDPNVQLPPDQGGM